VKAAILSIGDELVLGQISERNAGWLSAQLADEGVSVIEHRTVPDAVDAITEALATFAGRCDVVISTGGLGPTDDDLLRPALLAVLGGGALVEDAEARARIESWFAGRSRPMPAINLRQAKRPPSARCLPNDHGTAPGLIASVGRARFWALPGPPSEMKPMFERFVRPVLFEDREHTPLLRESISVFGLGESVVAERLGELMHRDRNPLVGTTASGSVVTIRLRAHGAAAHDRPGFDALVADVLSRMKPYALGVGGVTLPQALAQAARSAEARVALAESCTGGLAASMICDLPGASAWFRGGIVAYSNDLKQSLLDVPAATIECHGAVSAECAGAMALGAMRRLSASAAASITGIAGPEGGSDSKPVGTVFIATVAGGSADLRVHRYRFMGDRTAIRDRAARTALGALRMHLEGWTSHPLLGAMAR